ncbi:cytochrome c oxidase subunit 3 [Ferrimonas pelagia]|uniref:Cytochrome c oxidase subunit 3 n=1 Tax=Ferrimonas pelagia TaxID=1177826 RepID=A0ABP9FDT9_9GAMM
MKAVQTLAQKPWQAGVVDAPPSAFNRFDAMRTGLKFMIAVITSMFMLFMVAMVMRSQLGDWQPLTEQPWQPLFETSRIWQNTWWLLASSLLMQGAYWSCTRGALLARGLLLAGAFTAVAFLFGQYQLWQDFVVRGLGVQSSVAVSFFYLLTGLHALHLLVGLLFWPRSARALWHGQPQVARQHLSLLLMYWHFLMLLWLVLFALLTSTPATYKALAALCGVDVTP